METLIPQLSFNPIKAAAIVVALAAAIIGHEIMHGYVAYRYGDATAKSMGRLSVNPLVHVDPVGTVIVPLLLYISGAPFLFGWAKPVPVNMMTVIRNGGYGGGIAVSLAGIIYNLFVATVASLILGLGSFSGESGVFAAAILYYLVIYNVILAVFNLWPIPPLDGSNALRFLAMGAGWRGVVAFVNTMERYGMIILIVLLATPLSRFFLLPAYWLMGVLLG